MSSFLPSCNFLTLTPGADRHNEHSCLCSSCDAFSFSPLSSLYDNAARILITSLASLSCLEPYQCQRRPAASTGGRILQVEQQRNRQCQRLVSLLRQRPTLLSCHSVYTQNINLQPQTLTQMVHRGATLPPPLHPLRPPALRHLYR